MLFAYVHCFGVSAEHADLCLIADRPDQASVPVRIDTLELTEAAVLRISQLEAVTVRIDPQDNGVIIEPYHPSKLFITPDQPQYPGVHVKRLKVHKLGQRRYRTFFQQEKDPAHEWREWVPFRDK